MLSDRVFLRAFAYERMVRSVRCRRLKPVTRRRTWCTVRRLEKCFALRLHVTHPYSSISITSAFSLKRHDARALKRPPIGGGTRRKVGSRVAGTVLYWLCSPTYCRIRAGFTKVLVPMTQPKCGPDSVCLCQHLAHISSSQGHMRGFGHGTPRR